MTHTLSAILSLLLIGCAPPPDALGDEAPFAAPPSEPAEADDEALDDTGWDTGEDGIPRPPPACSGNACDGQDPVAMGCTGLSTLANGTNGAVTWALRYSSVCQTAFVRAWRHSTAGQVQARVWRESDLVTYEVDEPTAAVADKLSSGMVYCPSGSCSAMACARDSSTGSYTCSDWK
ncbi:DUF2690 domain-containing protein [Myxococcota bacterium]|nr:DUF2690 domain-containing protein [Myxococcota bacterium]